MSEFSSDESSSDRSAHGVSKSHVITGFLIVLVIAALFEYWMITNKNNQIANLTEQKTAVETDSEMLRADLNEMAMSIDEVAGKLQDVRKNQVKIADLVNRSETDKSKKTQILNDITLVEGQLKQDRQDMDALAAKLAKSTTRIKSLENVVNSLKNEIEINTSTITQLRASLEEKDQVISSTRATLRNTEDNLSNVRTELERTASDLEQTKNVLEDTVNTGYYVIGTQKAMKTDNVIAENGFLIKKTLVLAPDLNRGAFTKIDISRQKTFNLDCAAKDVKLVPVRSAAAFTLEDAGEGKSVLKVVDTEKFWQIRYLVVLVKG